MKKRLISNITLFTLLLTTVFFGMSTPAHATETDIPEALSNDPIFIRDSETGHIGIEEPAVYSRRSSESSDTSEEIAPNSYAPSYWRNIQYMYTHYPRTRNQYSYGTCWAHAATACAEMDLVTNHGVGKDIDLSELQLTWFAYHTGNELPGLDGDNIMSGTKHYLDAGGNIVYSMHTMAQWKTFTYEQNLPYTYVTSNKSYIVPSNYNNYHDGAQLRNVRYLNIKTDRNSVKQAIMEQGSVYISYYYESKYYNTATNMYCFNGNHITNHDIVIVGWNDSKGAWLARNSWDETTSGNGSEYTYFWLSYDDTGIANTAYSLDFKPYCSTDNLYQYDGVVTHEGRKYKAAANIYTANSSMPLGSERLDSVMIPFTMSENVNYKIEVYTNTNPSDPTKGYLNSSSTTTGWTTSKGIYTIDLKKPVYLSPGEKFSIVVTALNGPVYFNIEKSKNITYNENNEEVSWFNTTAHADKGESFYTSGSGWKDATTHGDKYGNICIKAITSDSNIQQYDINYELNGGTNSSSNPVSYLSTYSGSFTLKTPKRSGYHFLGWYSDSSFKNKVTSINYGNKKNITLYAKWCSNENPSKFTTIKKATTSANGSYKSICKTCGLSKGTFTSYKISSIGLNYTKLTYNGSNRSPKPVVKSSNGKTLVNDTDYTYTYNKSSRKSTGRYYVTIKFKGRYSADPVKKYFTIVPKAPSSVNATLYGYDDIKISWSKCTGASGYAVYYKKSTSSKYTLLKRTTARTLKKANLPDNVKYNFKVVPYYKYKSGSKNYYAGTNYKTASAITLKKLAQPKMKKQGSRVSLTWQSISGASGYQVYWSAKKNGTYKKLSDYSNKYVGMSFSVGKGTPYYYKTRAYKIVGKTKIYGPWSTPKAYTFK